MYLINEDALCMLVHITYGHMYNNIIIRTVHFFVYLFVC